MIDPHCKIGKVTYKTNLRLLKTTPRCLSQADVARVREGLDNIAKWFGDDLAGLVVVGFTFDGRFNRATRVHKDCAWGETVLPLFVADILRRDTMKSVSDETFFGN